MAGDRTPTVLGWADLTAMLIQVADRAGTDGPPDVVVGVLRGGLVPAVLLAHLLGVRAVRAVEVVHTTSDKVDATKTVTPRVFNPASLGRLDDMNVLVVDDIAGSGDTLTRTVDLVHDAGAADVRTAVCVVNTVNWRRPDCPDQALTYIGATLEGWVIFPWERQ